MSLAPLQVTVISGEHVDDLPEGPVVSRAQLPAFDGAADRFTHFDTFRWSGEASAHEGWQSALVSTLMSASANGQVNYVVPGHPLLGDATVQFLINEDNAGRIDLELFDEPLPFILTEVLALAEAPPAFVDALTLSEFASAGAFGTGRWPASSNQTVLVTNVVTSDHGRELTDLLMRRYRGDTEVRLIPMLGAATQVVTTLSEIAEEFATRSCYLVLPAATGDDFQHSPDDLQRLVARLRAPNGCPWDREQTNLSLARNLIEESYELLDAIESEDRSAMREELGDFILQAWLHCQIATEDDAFTLEDVIETLVAKLIRRHPHVFADTRAGDSDAVVRTWDEIKRSERSKRGAHQNNAPLGDVPKSLPSLMRAQSLLKRAGRSDYSPDDVVRFSEAATGRLDSDLEREIVEQMLSAINAAQASGIDVEQALRSWTYSFEDQIQAASGATARSS